MSKFQKFQIHCSTKVPMGGVVTAVTLAFSPFTSYVKETDGRLKPNDCLDFRILDTIARFYNITVSPQGDWVPICPIAYYSPPQVNIKEPSDGQWGRQMENGSWTGVVAILIFPVSKVFFFVWWQFCFPNFLRFITLVCWWEPWKKGRLTSRWTWLWLAQERKWSTTLWHT